LFASNYEEQPRFVPVPVSFGKKGNQQRMSAMGSFGQKGNVQQQHYE
jgi:hypothetical protein